MTTLPWLLQTMLAYITLGCLSFLAAVCALFALYAACRVATAGVLASIDHYEKQKEVRNSTRS